MTLSRNDRYRLTNRERDILDILWESGKSMVASEITSMRDDLSINTVQAVLKKLLQKKLIAVDEIGTPEDVHAIEYAMHCGCKMLATVHAESMEELRKKPLFNRMIGEGRFERYILLGNDAHVGQIEGIFDNRGSLLYKEMMEMAK